MHVATVFSAHLFLMLISSTRPSMQFAVRGGIRVTGSFAYHIEPEACIKLNITCEQGGEGPGDLERGDEGSGDLEQQAEGSCDLEQGDEGSGDLYAANPSNGTCTKLWIGVTYCTAVYGSWPDSDVELYAYYQIRKVKLWPVS